MRSNLFIVALIGQILNAILLFLIIGKNVMLNLVQHPLLQFDQSLDPVTSLPAVGRFRVTARNRFVVEAYYNFR